MQGTCRNCLAQEVCDITGGVCQKMDALFAQRKSVTNGRTTMTNPKNSATPKTVAEKQTASTEETVVPSQAASPKPETNNIDKPETNIDKVVDRDKKILFAGTPSEMLAWLNERSERVYVIQVSGKPDLITSVDYLKMHQGKLSPVQRIKVAAEKFSKNRKALAILGASVIVAGLAIKNSRKTTVVEVMDVEVTGVADDPDETNDSL